MLVGLIIIRRNAEIILLRTIGNCNFFRLRFLLRKNTGDIKPSELQLCF